MPGLELPSFTQAQQLAQQMAESPLLTGQLAAELLPFCPTKLCTTTFAHFASLSQLDRRSGHERHVREYVAQLAFPHYNDGSLGLIPVRQMKIDKVGNAILYADGRGSGVGADPSVLQVHMDIVDMRYEGFDAGCKRTLAVESREIERGRRERVLYAQEGSLGADNNLSLSAILAVLQTPGIDHPPLEIVFTSDEEGDMQGIKGLDYGLLRTVSDPDVQRRYWINLDMEEEGIFISAAGGRDLKITLPVSRDERSENEVPVNISLTGLKGGHSGLDVDKGHGNAQKILFEALGDGVDIEGIRFASLQGGLGRSSIPTDATLVVWCHKGKATDFCAQVKRALSRQTRQLEGDDISVQVEIVEDSKKPVFPPVMDSGFLRKLQNLVSSMADGVIERASEIPAFLPDGVEDFVATSNTWSLSSTTNDAVNLLTMTRSNRPGGIESVQEPILTELRNSEFRFEFGKTYPLSPPRESSSLLEIAQRAHGKLHSGQPARVKGAHCGLEFAFPRAAYPELEIDSRGPTILGAHGLRECVVLRSVPPFLNGLVGLLGELCQRT